MTKISGTNLLYNYRQGYYKDNCDISVPKQNTDKKNNTIGNCIIPISLLTVGGILLYMGVRMPDNNKLFKNFIAKRVSDIDVGIDSISKILQDSLKKISDEVEQLVTETLNKRKWNIKNYQQNLDKVSDNKTLKNLMESEVERVSTTECKLLNEDGHLSLADELDIRYSAIKSKHYSKFETDKTTLENGIKDSATVSFKDTKQMTENEIGIQRKLETYSDIRVRHIEEDIAPNLEGNNISCYKILLNLVEKLRNQKYENLDKVLQLAKEKAGVKTEDTIEVAKSKIKTISKEDLKPIKKSQLDEEYLSKNGFIKLISEIDFNKISKEDLDELFSQLNRDVNIRDLKFLFKKIEFYKQLAKKENKANTKVLENLNIKLAYIIDELTKKCETELLNKAKLLNFDNTNDKNFNSNLVAINDISKRLGFTSFKELDTYMTSKYQEYQQTSFHKQIEKSILNSKYFML